MLFVRSANELFQRLFQILKAKREAARALESQASPQGGSGGSQQRQGGAGSIGGQQDSTSGDDTSKYITRIMCDIVTAKGAIEGFSYDFLLQGG